MIGLFYLSSNAFMFSCIMLFEWFRWTSFFCYLWSSSLLVMLCVLADLFNQWYRQRQIDKWLREGDDDDD